MTQPLSISIVTPSYNQASFLEDTIKSVLDQNYTNLEYVIIDGGSTDESVNIIKKYSDKLHYWVSERDKGHGDALNKGFSHTTGEIMAWLNSDDKYMPWTFEVVSEIFSRFPEVNWIVGFNAWLNEKGAITYAKREPKNIYDFLLGNYQWIQQESVFWRRSAWEKAGGYIDQHYKYMVDGELWSRFFLSEELYTVDCILAGYRAHSSNRAKLNYNNCLAEMEKAIQDMMINTNKDILYIYKIYKWIKYVNSTSLLKYFPVKKLVRKYYEKTYLKSQYKNIFHKDGEWEMRLLPFSTN